MPYFEFVWNDEIKNHISQNDISSHDFEQIVCNPKSESRSRSTGLPIAFGYTADGRYMMAVYELLDDVTVLPVTAYEVPESRM